MGYSHWATGERCFESEWLRSVAFSPDGLILAISNIHLLLLYNWQSKRLLQTLTGHTHWIWDMAFHPNSRTVATISYYDYTLRLWDVRTGHCHHICLHPAKIGALAFSPTGETVVTAGEDAYLYLWNTETGVSDQTWSCNSREITSLSFRPDGGSIAVGSDDSNVWLFDVHTETWQMLVGHHKRVNKVQFCPNGRYLASASDDGTIRLWDAHSGRLTKVLHSPKPYEQMNIHQISGITPFQKRSLVALGAIEHSER